MQSLRKFLYLLLVISKVSSESMSWDSSCTEKYPECLWDDDKYHTNIACEHKTCGPRFEGCLEIPPDAEFRQAMLDRHNELRNKVASGEEKRGGMTNAANMRALSYDLGLEYTAICHVHGCKMEHDKCRSTSAFSSAGQNLGLMTDKRDKKMSQEDIDKYVNLESTTAFVNDWYEEITLANFKDDIDNFQNFQKSTGHFTGMIFATTTHMGCAKAIDRSDEYGYTFHVTCNYAPSGNFEGKPMFIKGAGCSKCPDGIKCNTKYTSLCGEVDTKDINAVGNPFRAEDINNGHYKTTNSNQCLYYNVVVVTVLLILKEGF